MDIKDDGGMNERREIFEEAADQAYNRLLTLQRVAVDDSPVEVGSHQPTSNNDFADAREIMSERLQTDEDLRHAYMCNISMLIFDNQNAEPYHLGDGKVASQPLDLSSGAHCNAMAERLIKLIFES